MAELFKFYADDYLNNDESFTGFSLPEIKTEMKD
jgi:hypothetical protein